MTIWGRRPAARAGWGWFVGWGLCVIGGVGLLGSGGCAPSSQDANEPTPESLPEPRTPEASTLSIEVPGSFQFTTVEFLGPDDRLQFRIEPRGSDGFHWIDRDGSIWELLLEGEQLVIVDPQGNRRGHVDHVEGQWLLYDERTEEAEPFRWQRVGSDRVLSQTDRLGSSRWVDSTLEWLGPDGQVQAALSAADGDTLLRDSTGQLVLRAVGLNDAMAMLPFAIEGLDRPQQAALAIMQDTTSLEMELD